MLLDGVRVVSFCHFLQGPAAAQYLADMGADVIKVEPLGGAHERHWSGADVFVNGVSGFYLCANRNKRAIAIDLKHTGGRAVARKRIESADVVMENCRPGVFAKLGFDDDALKALKPDLIFASASGYGSTGPLAAKPGQDLLMQARSGLMSVTGNPENGPTPAGAAVVDQHGGALFAMGILAALIRKLRTGEGTRVEASLLNAALDLQQEPLVNYLAGGANRNVLSRGKNLATWFHAAPYGVYAVKDGHVALSLNDPAVLAAALDSEELAAAQSTDRYRERDLYAGVLASALAEFTIEELEGRFDHRGIWWAPVKYYDELLDDPQIKHADVFQTVNIRGRAVRLLSHPNRYDGQAGEARVLALEVGQHTREILNELEYSPADIEALIQAGGVSAPRVVEQENA